VRLNAAGLTASQDHGSTHKGNDPPMMYAVVTQGLLIKLAPSPMPMRAEASLAL